MRHINEIEHDEPFAVNLRVATVLDPGFPDLIGRLAAREHDTLIVELAEADRTAARVRRAAREAPAPAEEAPRSALRKIFRL